MTDPEAVTLLREIRDLQQQLLLSHKEALAGQREAIANQREAIERQRFAMRRIIPLVVVLLVLVVLGPWLIRWMLYMLGR